MRVQIKRTAVFNANIFDLCLVPMSSSIEYFDAKFYLQYVILAFLLKWGFCRQLAKFQMDVYM